MAGVEVLTTGEAAKYCGVNFRTIIRWIERGKLKAYKLPGRGDHRIQRQDLVAFLHENQMPVPADLQDTKRLVLVVEDQPEMASAIRRVLRQAGYEVEVAHDGFVAGSMLERLRPRVITLDLKMPGLDGYQVLRHIRSHPELIQSRVLVISAETQAGLDRALQEGADDVLVKPFVNEELLVKIEALMSA